MKTRLVLLAAVVTLLLRGSDTSATIPSEQVFLVKPYLQLGDAPALARGETLVLVWHASTGDAKWSVEVKPNRGGWRKAAPPATRRIAVRTIEPHWVFSVTLDKLKPGEEFAYRVLHSAKPVFESVARARKAADQPYRLVLFGDCAAGTPEQRVVAHQAWLAKPDAVLITGDIVYSRGRISEYRQKFFPVYNAEQSDPAVGAPLLRSTLFLAAPGNHDIATFDVAQFPDAQAYFHYWRQPLNGPWKQSGTAGTPILRGPEADQKALIEAAGGTFPAMANFSFDYGNAHWTVLDSNSYVDWTNPALREWVTNDLKGARGAAWRFVAYHHPGFNSSRAHFDTQWPRLLADVFEEGGVDIVFSGHVHNYQRSFPMLFQPQPWADGKLRATSGQVTGAWTLDREFDGDRITRANGVIYIVTGGGGARLYDPDQERHRATWQPFTARFHSTVHSITVLDVKGRELIGRQVSKDGVELDRFKLTK